MPVVVFWVVLLAMCECCESYVVCEEDLKVSDPDSAKCAFCCV